MGTPEMDQERHRRLLQEVGSGIESEENNLYEDESDEEEQDFQETVNHKSESEEDISDADEEDVIMSTSLSFLGTSKNNIFFLSFVTIFFICRQR